MKKIISLLLALCLLLSACGTRTPDSKADTTPAESTSEAASAASTAAESTTPETTEPETTAPESTAPESTVQAASEAVERTKVNFGLLAGPTGMGAAKLLYGF